VVHCDVLDEDLVLGRRPLGAILHPSNEPGELSQWLCHDVSTINIVMVIIIIKHVGLPCVLNKLMMMMMMMMFYWTMHAYA